MESSVDVPTNSAGRGPTGRSLADGTGEVYNIVLIDASGVTYARSLPASNSTFPYLTFVVLVVWREHLVACWDEPKSLGTCFNSLEGGGYARRIA
jgi:hypothetical protein